MPGGNAFAGELAGFVVDRSCKPWCACGVSAVAVWASPSGKAPAIHAEPRKIDPRPIAGRISGIRQLACGRLPLSRGLFDLGKLQDVGSGIG